MLDPANELVPPLSSPSISSISSSDLDTESTGSFFHDRSTTLGTLMGVSFPAIAFRVPSQNRDPLSGTGAGAGGSKRNGSNKKKKTAAAAVAADRRRRWWQLCREGDVRPASLGDFLEEERRVDVGDGAFYGTAAELESMVGGGHQQRNGGRMLFSDGRVLPPAEDVDGSESVTESLCNRFPVSLAGICSGGAG